MGVHQKNITFLMLFCYKVFTCIATGVRISLGAQSQGSPEMGRSFTLNSPSEEFESPWVPQPITNVAAFLAGLRFEKRDFLNGLLTISLLTSSSQGIGNPNSES